MPPRCTMNTEASKPIRLSNHARGYLVRRGFTETEVHEAIRTRPWQPAPRGRQEVIKDFPYQALWNGTFYTTKRVRPIFVEEATEIVVVTVYTYFF
jgi:hypothetical protein